MRPSKEIGSDLPLHLPAPTTKSLLPITHRKGQIREEEKSKSLENDDFERLELENNSSMGLQDLNRDSV